MSNLSKCFATTFSMMDDDYFKVDKVNLSVTDEEIEIENHKINPDIGIVFYKDRIILE